MKALICGAGIAGLTTALCLARAGHDVTILEKSPEPRDGGYMIDFFGPGFDAAEKLGLLSDLERVHYPISRLSFVDRRGDERVGLPYLALRKQLFDNRHFNFLRGDVERVLRENVPSTVEMRYGISFESIDDDGGSTIVTLTNGTVERADVLIGADGLHSKVRNLSFGDEQQFLRFLGFYTAAFLTEGAVLAGDSTAFRTLTVPNKEVAIYPVRGGRTATFFVHRSERLTRETTRHLAEGELRRVYGSLDWVVPELLDLMPNAPSLYFDSVSQIVMPSWSKGRVVLVGDACWCVSLLAGQGASLAIAGGLVLADELNRSPQDIPGATTRYEARLRPAIEKRQASGRSIANWFVPSSQFGIVMRDLLMRTSIVPGLSWIVRRQLAGGKLLTS